MLNSRIKAVQCCIFPHSLASRASRSMPSVPQSESRTDGDAEARNPQSRADRSAHIEGW